MSNILQWIGFCNIFAVRRWWITKWSRSGWKPNLFLALLYVTLGEQLNKVSMWHLLTHSQSLLKGLEIFVHKSEALIMRLTVLCCLCLFYLQSSIGVWRRWGPSIKCRIPISPNCKMKDLSSWTKYFSICKIFWWRVRIQCVAIYKTYCGTFGFGFV